MTTPLKIIQLLPHIADAIAYTLTFADLINCVQVNHEWNDAFTRILYEDVITFRSKQARPNGDWDGCEYFVDPSSRRRFARHAHHIRGLTCQRSQLASILLETLTFDNLIEVNLIQDDGPFSADDTSIDSLTGLLARSPLLQAVSIENVDFRSMEQIQRLLDFVKVLEKYPAVTCVYFDGDYIIRRSGDITGRSGDMVSQIWKRLMARVSTSDTQRVRTLAMQRPELLSRSNRGPNNRGSWTSRERPLQIRVPETNLWREIHYTPVAGLSDVRYGGGRWEDEVWTKLRTIKNLIAVIHRTEELHLACDESYLNDELVFEMMHGYRLQCREFMLGPWNIFTRQFWARFPGVLPNLERHLKLGLTKHWSTLVEVDLDVMDFYVKKFWKLLANSPKLQSVRIPVLLIDGFEPTELPEWATGRLDKLSIGLYLEGHERDLERGTSIPQPESEPELANNPVEAARRIGPLLMAQINRQSNLHELELSFNHRRHLRRSPVFALSLDRVAGLPQLSNLGQLERFVVSGLLLPHITDAIAETLTFAELVHCVRVDHEWHDAFTKHLYEDFVTFHSRQVRPGGSWNGYEYFIDTSSCLNFVRYSHLVRGITCEPRQLANILLETPTLDSLIEINYILDANATSRGDSMSLDTLTELIARSRCLQAVSNENIAFSSEELLQRLLPFVDVLDQYPAIICVYFDGPYCARRADMRSVIWKRLWTRVPRESDQHIKTLVMFRQELLTRSNRGPSRGRAWTPRERPMQIHVPETDLWCDRDYVLVAGVSTLGGSGSGGGKVGG
ncbi:hypothetical protein BG006_011344 [Podila minutissima]|uniref:F-box domain-containing protein n=1 Tax=Podila minutissima TaxID=64525 RepID=A0A9P5VI07_9FUNG|nr:hypothetical protein BG006_011344 [Podila minutissima]